MIRYLLALAICLLTIQAPASVVVFVDPDLAGTTTTGPPPRPDAPAAAVAFRQLQWKDARGSYPANAFVEAKSHADAMRARVHARFASTGTSLAGATTTGSPSPGGAGPLPGAAGTTRRAWTWLGPGNIGGRVRSLAIDPADPNIMFAGGVAGGLFKSTDRGASWTPVDDFMANLAVSTIVMQPNLPTTLYAGTGEGFYNHDGIRGAGVFTSTDGGVTWAQLASTATPSWWYVNRLAISPNGAVMLAATRTGVYRSTDGGVSWTNTSNKEATDVVFHPTDSTKAIVSGYAGNASISIDGGATWTASGGLPGGTFVRAEVAYARSNPTVVYASVDVNGGSIYKSMNGGASFALVFNGAPDYLGTQGWYGNALWVDPTRENTLVVGGLDLWKSTNGGVSLSRISSWLSAPESVHADQHAIVEDPGFNGTTNTTVWFTNDGGVYRADSVYTAGGGAAPYAAGWHAMNNNLGVTQFYGASGGTATGVILGGTQDNGTLKYTPASGTAWSIEFGGDGGASAVDPANNNNLYGEYSYGSIHRSVDGGATADWINGLVWNGTAYECKPAPFSIPDTCGAMEANFVAPLILDPNNSNRLFVGGASLWRTNDVTTPNTATSGPSWTSVKASAGVGNYISAVAVAPGRPDEIWVGHNNGQLFKSINGASGAPTWVPVGGVALPGRFVTRVRVDPTNTNTVYVAYGSFSPANLWKTTDGGVSWTSASGSGLTGLPPAPVRDIAIAAAQPSWLYAATEVGIFTSQDGGSTWTVPNDGPANVSVEELFWLGPSLVAVTHGRGLFTTTPNLSPQTPTMTWLTPAAIPYGTPLSAAQLNATSNVAGTLVYTPAAGTVLPAGIGQTLSVIFTPTDSVNYTTASASVAITVDKATPVITWPAPANIVFGTALGAAQLNATSGVPGTLAYAPPAGTVLPAGAGQTLSVTFTPADPANYAAVTTSRTITVTKATPAITWPAPAGITYPTALGAAQLNATASVPGSFVYTPAAGTVLNAGAGQTLSVTFTPADAASYTTATATRTISVAKATPTIAWTTPAAITYGTALGAAQLNASASVAGTFVYTPAAGTVLNAGAGQTLSVAFTPGDTANYNNASSSRTITVNKATPTLVWAAPAAITYGTTLGPAQLNATASVPGAFVYAPAAGTVLPAGASQTLSVTFTPTDAVNFTTAARSVAIAVGKATPVISWATPASITYGSALGGTQLNAMANVPGTFVYTPPAGTLLNAGASQPLSATFTPADAANYTPATASVAITVGKRTPAISWSAPAPIAFGVALSAAQLNATADVPGSFVYTPPAGTVPDAGDRTLSVAFTPADAANYTTATASVAIAVGKTTPAISWSAPASIVYGTALSASQLNAIADVPGTFVYTPPAGTVLHAGAAQALTAAFTPADTTNYAPATATVPITVGKATPMIAWNAPADITYGTALSAAQLNATSDAPGTFAYLPPAGAVLNAGAGQTLSVAFTPADAANYATAAANTSIRVVKATPLITWNTTGGITYGTPIGAAQLNASASIPGTFAYSPAAGAVLNAGVQTLSTTFSPADSVNYTPATRTVPLFIAQATPVIVWPDPADIISGTPLGPAQLNATSTVPGAFVYSPAAGTMLPIGFAQTLSASFVPTDAANYAAASATARINVLGSTPAIDTAVWTDQPAAVSAIVSPALSTSTKNELVLAFIATDFNTGTNTSVTGVTGAGLTWALVGRTNVQRGTSEIWRAFAPARLTNAIVTASLSQPVSSMLTVVSFANVDTSGINGAGAIGATAAANRSSGAPTATLVTTRNNSWVFGVGNDFDNPVARTLGAGQTMVHQYLAPVGDTYWVQRTTAVTPAAGTSVTINATAPTNDRYNLFIAEIRGPGVADTTAPTVSLTAPAAGATVSGSNLTVSASAADNIAVAGVQFKLDGANLGAEDTTSPYSLAWNTATAANGAHTLTAVARDSSGNTATAIDVNVVVANVVADTTAPSVSMTAPAAGASLSGAAATVSASAADNVGVVGVQFLLDGLPLGVEIATPPYTLTWSTLAAANGVHTLAARARDAANNAATSAAVSVTIANLATPTISWASPSAIVYGTALGAGQLNATANVPGTFVYTPPAGTLLNAGAAQALSVSFTPADTVNYTSATASVAIAVGKATPSIAWSAPADVAFGTALGAAQLNATADVPGTFIYTPAAGTVLNAGAGQTLSASFTPADPANYTSATASVTITVGQTTPSIAWSTPASIVYGTALGAAQLNASAGVPGTFAYTPAAGTLLGAGPGQVLSVVFTPADTANYSTATASVTISVGQATPALGWSTPAAIVYGTALGAAQLNATASTPGAFSYTPLAGTVVGAGASRPLSATFSPSDSANYTTATVSTTITVLKATPAIAWATPANITPGTALSAAQLNATADVPGTFVYTPPAGTVLSAGSDQMLQVVFTPTDAANYVPVSASVLIDVVAAVPTIDNAVWTDQPSSVSSIVSPAFSTNTANELLLAFVATDFGSGTNTSVTSVTGAGLTWVLVGRTNVEAGTSEIWRAFAPARLTNATVTANLSQPVSAMLTVVSFANVDASGTDGSGAIGATASASRSAGAPTATLVTTRNNSWVFGVGNDYDNPIARTLGAGQTMVHQYLAPVGDAYWVQRTTAVTPAAGTSVTINATAPTGDRSNLFIVEIRGPAGADTTAPTVALTAPAAGAIVSGTSVPVSASATDNVDVAGVLFLLDGAPLGAEVTAPPYAMTWATTATSNGAHALSARARDAAGNLTMSAPVSVTVANLATPAITWPAPAAIVYGTALTSVQLNATASVPGTFAYLPAAGTVLNAGVAHTLSVTFTPSDPLNFASATASVPITVARATPPVTWPAPGAIAYGTALGATQLNASATVPGTFVYTPAAGTVLGAGAGQTLSVTFTPSDAENYTTATASVTIGVGKAASTITWPTPADIAYGTPLSATQLNATANVAGTFLYSPPAGTVLNAGTAQAVSVTFTPTDAANYAAATASASINVGKATPAIVWNGPADITYGTALTSAQLNATASVPGTFAYLPAAGTVLNAGVAQTLSVTFMPSDVANYTTATASVTIGVGKAASTITWPTPADIAYGTALSTAQLNATANVPGAFVYAPDAGTVLNAGAGQTLSVIFTPTEPANYTTATASVSINVGKAPPTIVWNAPGDIIYGTALSAAQLNASANVPGTFAYSPPSGTVLNAGAAHTLSVTFTPTEAANYAAATASVSINVGKAAPAISWNAPAAIVYGTPLGAAQLNALANVPGTFAYAPVAGTVPNAGAGQTLSVIFTPADPANYTTAAATAAITIVKAIPAITWTPPTTMIAGTPLGAAQLNATANVPGAFVYTPAAGTVLPVGPSQPLALSFTPADAANYATVTAAATITVLDAKPAIDALVWTDQASAASPIVSPAFSTSQPNELLLAFVGTDYNSGTNTSVTNVTGGGLTWVLVARTNVQSGTSEIWRAFAPSPLVNVTVAASMSQPVSAMITVVSFANVDTSGTNGSGAIGTVASANASFGGPTASLVTTRNNSWVFGVGNDFDRPIARTLGTGQTMVHQYLAPVGDTYWVQRTTALTPLAGTTVRLNDTAPTSDRYNFTICEIRGPQ